MFGLITAAGIKLIAQSELTKRNLLILGLSLSFGIGMYLKPEFASHIPDLGIKLQLLLTTLQLYNVQLYNVPFTTLPRTTFV